MSADECDEPDTVAHAGEENVIEAEKDGEIEDEGRVEMRPISDDGNEQLEDGELEDGEIDDEPAETGTDNQKESVENLDEVQQDDKPKSSKKDKRKRKRSKRDKSQESDARKRSKKKRYVDHDRINDEDDMTWLGEQEHSNRRQKKYTDHDNMGNGGHSPTGDLYDSPYDSPPGLYDSPSDGEGDDRGPTSMLGLVQDDFMDVNISAQEKQSVDMEKGSSKRLSRKKHKSKQSEGRGSKHCSRKTPLVELPRSERPHCKFFKEGKCQKGSTCPFNHDFQPEKRNDVCKFYLTSACNRENCLFMHSEFPCKYFHAGKGCYAGDDCKFSHESLTEETQIYFDRMMEEEMIQRKPSLLGSPPQHVIDEAERMKERIEHVKKIPSIFEIETFPPGHSPRKSPQKNISPIRPPGPGFYNETGPPLLPQGPPSMNNQAPIQTPQMNNLGSHMNNMGPPMNSPPMNNLGPPMNNLGPSMTNLRPPMSIRPPFPGGQEMPPNQAGAQGSVLNMIGAILRTAAPLIVNQISGQPPNNYSGQRDTDYGHGGSDYGQEDSDYGQRDSDYGQMNCDFGHSNNEQSMTENDQNYPTDVTGAKPTFYGQSQGVLDIDKPKFENSTNKSYESKDVLSEKMSNFQDEKDFKVMSNKVHLDPRSARAQLAARPLETEPPLVSSAPLCSEDDHPKSHLDGDQGNTFMQQKDDFPAPKPDMDFGPKFEFSSLKDDNWYSSDEEETGDDEKLCIVQQPPVSSSVPSLNKSSTFDIMEMISNVRNDKSLLSSSSSLESKKPEVRPSFYSPSMTLSQSYNIKPQVEVSVPVTHCVLKNMLYRIKTFTFSSQDKPYDKLPVDVKPVDSRYQSDPRVQKYSQRLARKTLMQPKLLAPEKKVDRVQLPDLNLNSDGTINAPKPRALDPRMSRNLSTGSDDSRPQIPDQRSLQQDQRSAVQDPRSQLQRSQDPRSPSQEPRPQHQNPRAQNKDPRFQDPRSQTKDPRAQHQDPRSQHQDPRSQHQDPRSQHQDPRSQNQDQRSQQLDLRLQNQDPRSQHQDPRSQRQDPRMRRSQDSNDSALTLKLKNILSDPSDTQRPGLQRADPRVSRSVSLEGGIQGKNAMEKSKLSSLSDFPSLLNRPNPDQFGLH